MIYLSGRVPATQHAGCPGFSAWTTTNKREWVHSIHTYSLLSSVLLSGVHLG